ncbi:MAG: AarF/ABC1/UbiB kinase family protein, partial [Verrucomicrobiae bacterium]|nr:AarF/ABC1/UbiB kinase family protein [Verrucomicrobiae bacterium]
YAAWKPIVREAMEYIGSRLPPERLIPKLVEQIMKPDQPLELRFIEFIARMPTLQKLGQIIARNQHLDPRFRGQLIHLENSIRDVSPSEIEKLLHRRLGKKLTQFQVKIKELIHSEASVSAVTHFTWINPQTLKKEEGVFKIQKPGIARNFKEEMKILSGLAGHLNRHCSDHVLSEVDLPGLFKEVKDHLKRELDARHEQRNLSTAFEHYRNVPGIRVPRLIPEFCTPTITAMSYEPGRKVTDAYPSNSWRKNEIATRMVETLIAEPLYSSTEEAIFHADPHAGNLFVDESTHELVVFDWSLTESLSRDERKNMTRLFSALALRDEHMIFQVIQDLSTGSTEESSQVIYQKIHDFLGKLHPFHLPSLKQLLQLLDDIGMAGIKFSTGMIIFRKVLLTLEGVLADVGGRTPLETILARYAFKDWVRMAWGMQGLDWLNKPSTLSPMDTMSLIQSAQWYGLRTGMQALSRVLEKP